MLSLAENSTSIGLETLDATLLFQIVNSVLLFATVFAGPLLIILLMKRNKENRSRIIRMEEKVDQVLNRLTDKEGI